MAKICKRAKDLGWLIWLPAFFMAACGGSGDKGSESPAFKDQDLQGKVGGSAWVYLSGRTTEPHSDGRVLFQFVADEIASPCESFSFQTNDNRNVMFSLLVSDVKNGDYALKLDLNNFDNSRTVTIYDGETNFVASNGKISLTSVSTGSIEGKLVATFDTANSINGNFSLTRCCLKEGESSYEVCE